MARPVVFAHLVDIVLRAVRPLNHVLLDTTVKQKETKHLKTASCVPQGE